MVRKGRGIYTFKLNYNYPKILTLPVRIKDLKMLKKVFRHHFQEKSAVDTVALELYKKK